MNDKKITRRTALKAGAKVGVGAVMGYSFIPSIVSANALRRSVREFNVLDFGAEGDGTTLDTQAIQQAIDEASAAGGGARVVLPGGYRFYSGTLEMKSNIEFHLADDAEILISTSRDDYIGGAAIISRDIRNLKLSGRGTINGQGLEFMDYHDPEQAIYRPKSWRPRLFQLYTCQGLEIEDLTLIDSPLWGLHMVGCEEVLIDNMTIRNNMDIPNGDGINPDHCRHVEIKDCDIQAGDDAIVVKATEQDEDYGPSSHIHVYDCVLGSKSSGLKIGTETTDDIHDILFERCEIVDSNRGCTIQLRDSGNVYNIEFRDIDLETRKYPSDWWGLGEPISFTAFPRTFTTKPGNIDGVKLRNIRVHSENSVRINGSPESRIRNVDINNMSIVMERKTDLPGRTFDNRPTEVYTDLETSGVPAYSIRHADRISLKNCGVQWEGDIPEYFTYALRSENVTSLKIDGFEGESAHPELYDAIGVY